MVVVIVVGVIVALLCMDAMCSRESCDGCSSCCAVIVALLWHFLMRYTRLCCGPYCHNRTVCVLMLALDSGNHRIGCRWLFLFSATAASDINIMERLFWCDCGVWILWCRWWAVLCLRKCWYDNMFVYCAWLQLQLIYINWYRIILYLYCKHSICEKE